MNGFLKCISSKNNDSTPLELPKSFDISTEIKSKIAINVLICTIKIQNSTFLYHIIFI